jgi:hypothetical protein
MINRILACILIIAGTPLVSMHALATSYPHKKFDRSQSQANVIENSGDIEPCNLLIKSTFIIARKTIIPLVPPGKPQRALISDKDGGFQRSLVGRCSFDSIPRASIGSSHETESLDLDKVADHYVLFASPTSGHAPLTVTFTATGLQSSVSFKINYGDGSVSDSLHAVNVCTAPVGGNLAGCPMIVVSHTYNLAGKYRAMLANVPSCLPSSPGGSTSCKPAVLATVSIMIR